jgi:hypothetical protein
MGVTTHIILEKCRNARGKWQKPGVLTVLLNRGIVWAKPLAEFGDLLAASPEY